jgi:glycosyltransferase involved in cell wall biosynthesis
LSNHTTFAIREHADAPWVCVLDADLQHPPEVVPRLLVRRGRLRATEVPYTFADRPAGQSKGTLREGLTNLGSLANQRLGGGP